MLRRLLRDGSERAFLAKLDLFKHQPGLLEKYVIASEVSVEVLDLLFSRLFGTESSNEATGENPEPFGACNESPNRESDTNLAGRVDEHEAAIKGLQRQLAALQRQLEMQGEVTQFAESVTQRLDEVAGTCERLAEADRELREEIHDMDVRDQLGSFRADVERLQREVTVRANAAQVAALAEDVARLKEAEKKLEEQRKKVSLNYDSSSPLHGIIAHLTNLCGGKNVHKNEVVEVTASSINIGRPEDVADLQIDSHFYTSDKPSSWVCYDFKERRVAPTSYSIRSHNNPPGGAKPKSWVLEASNDGRDDSWVQLDCQNENNTLNDRLVTRNFPIRGAPRGSFRFIRFRQTGKNQYGNNYLAMSAFELFGTLYDA